MPNGVAASPMLVYILAPEPHVPYRWEFGGCHADAASWYCITRKEKMKSRHDMMQPAEWLQVDKAGEEQGELVLTALVRSGRLVVGQSGRPSAIQ